MTQAELLSIPWGGGLDESMDEAFTPPTSMRVAQNVVYPTPQSCTKRRGLTALATLANAKRIVKRGNEVLATDGLFAWSYSSTSGSMVNRGRMPPCMARKMLPLGQASSVGLAPVQAPLWSVAEGAGYRVSVWNDGNSVLASVYDVGGASFVRSNEVLALGAGGGSSPSRFKQPRVMVIGTTAIAIWYALIDLAFPGSAFVRASTLDLTNVAAGWSAPTGLRGSAAGVALVFDACPIPSTNQIAIIFGDPNSQDVNIHILSLALATVFSFAVAPSVTAPFGSCAIRPSASDNQVAWSYSTFTGGVSVVKFGVRSLDLSTQVLAPTTVGFSSVLPATSAVTSMGLERVYELGSGASAGYVLVCTYGYTISGTVPLARNQMGTFFVSAAGTISIVDQQPGYQMASKPFCVTVNGVNQYFILAKTSDYARPATSVLLRGRIQDDIASPFWFPVTTLTPEFADTASGTGLALDAAADVTFTTDSTQTVYTMGASVVTQALECASALFEIDFANVGLWQSVALGPYTYIACGTPMIYDGETLTEVGFLHAPFPPAATFNAGGGNVPANAATQYICCYAQQDSIGNVARSAPSAPIAVNVTAPGTVALTMISYISTYRSTGTGAGVTPQINGTPLYIEIYRNSVTAGSVYTLVARVPNAIGFPTTSYTDFSSDAAIASNPVLYTQTGAVPTAPAPSLYGLSVHADRLFGCDADGITTYYTTALEAGAQPRFADAFTITWPEGPLRATWSLEGRLHAATSRKIHFCYGDGPSENGTSSDFSTPQIWQADLGVVDARGLVITEIGVFFLSRKGIYLETRAGEYVWVGQRVQRTLSANGGAVTSMVALDNDGVVRISLGGAGATPPVLHYDYRNDRWSTLVYPAAIVSSVVAGSVWYGLGTPSGGSPTLYQESATSYLDGTTWVTPTLTTGWALPGDVMQGWGEVIQAQVVLHQESPFGVQVAFTPDYTATPDARVVTMTDAQITALTTQPSVQFRASTPVQYAMAISVTITDTAPTTGAVGTGQGATYQHLQLMMREKPGAYPHLNSTAVQ